MRSGGQRRHLGDGPHDLFVADLLDVDVLGLGIEGGQRSDGRHQHAHRVGVVVEALQGPLADVLVDERVVGDGVRPVLILLRGRQLAVDEQERNLEVGGLLGQLLDGVAAVAQHAGLAVEFGDGRLGRRGLGEAGVGEPDVAQQLLPATGVDAAVDYWDLDRLTGAVVGDGHGFGHGWLLRLPRR